MDQFLLNTEHFRRFYNCSFYDVDSVPGEQRRHLLLGILFIVVSMVEEVLTLTLIKFILIKRGVPECFWLLEYL
jgi:hypothetical protein